VKSLLTLTAIFELSTGLALVAIPTTTTSLLLGTSLHEPAGILVARIAGVSLISLAIACWFSKNYPESSLVIIKALIVYNISAAMLLAYSGLVDHFSGIGLWPAVIIHTVLFVWCIQSVREVRSERVRG
jgi:hypothetical protein